MIDALLLDGWVWYVQGINCKCKLSNAHFCHGVRVAVQ